MKLFKDKTDFVEKVSLTISYAMRMLLIIAAISSFFNQRWALMFSALVIFVLTFAPSLVERNYKIVLPIELEVLVTIFIFASLFLGEVHAYYTRFWWWDAVLHTGSGVVLGFAGFLILYSLYHGEKLLAKPIWIAFFSFCFALAIGAIWEIFEFGMDSVFGMNMQKSGLVDTMWDLIVDGIGALFAAVVGYFYLKGTRQTIFTRILKKYVEKNPQLLN